VSRPLFLVADLPAAGSFVLDGPEGHHAADVQRLRVGEELLLGDGRGGLASAAVGAVARGRLDVTVTAVRRMPPPRPRITIAQGIPKGDRGELAVQAMTEVGVDEILPWAAARSVTQWRGDRGAKARDKWAATARESAKQARRAWIPAVSDQLTTRQLAARVTAGSAFVLHEESVIRLTAAPLPDADEIVLVVGPEGGISVEELTALTDAGATPVRLGDEVLRTSTAGVAAISLLNARLGRW
jgi:16S rRNA (uracil1498-N3)-methyltransferase